MELLKIQVLKSFWKECKESINSTMGGKVVMLQKIRDNTYLIKGSPNTLIVRSDENLLVVDPGSEIERGRLIEREIKENFQDKKIEVFLTHSHSDHVAALYTMSNVSSPYISEQEVSSLIDIKVRKALTYSSSIPERILYRFVDISPKSYKVFKLGEKVSEITTVDLRGHSFGHAGFITEDHVLYSGDSFFGSKLISSVGIPYFLDYEDARNSLIRLKSIVEKDFIVVMSHGPVMKHKEAIEVIEMNLRVLEKIKQEVLSYDGYTAEEITYRLLKNSNVSISESSLILSCVTIKSILGYLFKEGLVKTEVNEKGLIWRVAKK